MGKKKNKKKKSVDGVLVKIVAGLALILGAIYFVKFVQEQGVERDLSLIGKGENIVVQIHDPA